MQLAPVFVRSLLATARLAQSAERKALNLVVVGSSPTVGIFLQVCINASEICFEKQPMFESEMKEHPPWGSNPRPQG